MTKKNYFAVVIYKVPSVLKAFIRIEATYAETVMETMALWVERGWLLSGHVFFFLNLNCPYHSARHLGKTQNV